VLPYFHLLSVVSTLVFVGVAMQFSDCPPTPPSETARVIQGMVERPIFARDLYIDKGKRARSSNKPRKHWQEGAKKGPSNSTLLIPSPGSIENVGMRSEYNTIAEAPSSAFDGPTEVAMEHIDADEEMVEYSALAQAPSPMMPGPVARGAVDNAPNALQSYGSTDTSTPSERNDDVSATSSPFPNLQGAYTPRNAIPVQPGFDYFNFGQHFQPRDHLPPTDDDGAEPVMTQTPRNLDIDVYDDQLWRSLRACFARKGFSHCVLAFATSGIAINTLSTFMGYLVTLNGVGREYVGIVGGSFQLLIMISSITCGMCTPDDNVRCWRYYAIIIALLALGALALALCDANLDSGERLWANILMVAFFIGPLQPLSTELGVEVALPLSKNTVLVIQQLFSNLLSAAFIPVFKALRDFSVSAPEFTYSFYFLILIQALATIYFASFYTQHLRHEEEETKKKKRREQAQKLGHEVESTLHPKSKSSSRRDQPWKKKYPFLIPQSST